MTAQPPRLTQGRYYCTVGRMRNVDQSRNYKIAVTGVLGALSIVLALTPIGYIQLGGLATITIMHIPAILAALFAGLVPGMSVGCIFGLTSLLRTIMMGGGANPFFMNPLVSVLPRVIFPVAVWGVNRALLLIPRFPKTLSGALSAALGTLIHTMLVMLSIYVLYGARLIEGLAGNLESLGLNVSALSPIGGYFAILAVMEISNGLWEILGAVLIVTAVLSSVHAAGGKKSKLRKLEEDGHE